MQPHLAALIDGMPASERRALLLFAAELDNSTPMSRIVRAIASELRARQIEDDAVMAGFEEDERADMDRLHARWPLPDPDPTMRFTLDPATGEFVRDEDVVNPDAGEL